jgi:hypothetical protein
MPYPNFLWLWEEAENGTWFPKWTDMKLLNGRIPSPLLLLILGSLHYLGRGFTFDDCEECTAISEDVHRVFFHEFINVGSTTLFDRYVITPKRTCAWKFVRSSYIGGDISYQNYLEETVPLNKMTSFLL